MRFNQSLLNDLFGGQTTPSYFIRPLHGEPLSEEFKVDIKENKGGFNIKAQIPGVRKEDIHVSVEGSMVSIQAEVKQLDEKKEDEKVVRSECYQGTVSRSFNLSAELDSAQTKASYENGVLNLYLPKISGIIAKQIVIN